MGLFDSLLNAGKAVLEQAEKNAEKQKSAISQGRMKQTDKVKGNQSPLPTKPGVYRHVNNETGEIDYVGQTNNLRKRQQEHARAGKLDTNKQSIQFATAKPDATKDQLCETEKAHIAKHNPSGNTTKGGNGRR